MATPYCHLQLYTSHAQRIDMRLKLRYISPPSPSLILFPSYMASLTGRIHATTLQEPMGGYLAWQNLGYRELSYEMSTVTLTTDFVSIAARGCVFMYISTSELHMPPNAFEAVRGVDK